VENQTYYVSLMTAFLL